MRLREKVVSGLKSLLHRQVAVIEDQRGEKLVRRYSRGAGGKHRGEIVQRGVFNTCCTPGEGRCTTICVALLPYHRGWLGSYQTPDKRDKVYVVGH